MSAAVQVLEVRAVEGSGNLRAFASVKLGCITIHRLKVVQQPSQKAWVSLPQRQVGTRWFPIVEISNREILAQVQHAVLEAWEAER